MKHKKVPQTQELIAKGVECENWLHSIVVEPPFFKVFKPDWIWHWENSSSWNCWVQGAWMRWFPELPSNLNDPKILFHKPLLSSCTAQFFGLILSLTGSSVYFPLLSKQAILTWMSLWNLCDEGRRQEHTDSTEAGLTRNASEHSFFSQERASWKEGP